MDARSAAYLAYPKAAARRRPLMADCGHLGIQRLAAKAQCVDACKGSQEGIAVAWIVKINACPNRNMRNNHAALDTELVSNV